MARFFTLCAGVIALATLAPAAWSQETPAPEDPLAKALTTVKSPAASRQDLMDARQYLVDQRQVARPQVVELLGNADSVVRLNAAIILCNMAKAGDTSAATLQAMQKAAADKNLAVAYWGFQGLMTDGVPAADQRTVISQMMKMEVPRALRLAALTTIGDQKLKVAVPIIVSHLQEILKEYKEQVETMVTLKPATRPADQVPFTGPGNVFPAPPVVPMPAPARHGIPPAASPAIPPSAAAPGAAAAAWSGGPVSRAQLAGVNMTLDKLQAITAAVEDIPIVEEVHHMGLVLEDIVANVSPDAKLFGFKTTPPWDLDRCVDQAVIYMNEHSAEYAVAPETPKPAPPAAAVTPGTAPAVAPVPATTAPAPAATTP